MAKQRQHRPVYGFEKPACEHGEIDITAKRVNINVCIYGYQIKIVSVVIYFVKSLMHVPLLENISRCVNVQAVMGDEPPPSPLPSPFPSPRPFVNRTEGSNKIFQRFGIMTSTSI